jgi:hypothetical protein
MSRKAKIIKPRKFRKAKKVDMLDYINDEFDHDYGWLSMQNMNTLTEDGKIKIWVQDVPTTHIQFSGICSKDGNGLKKNEDSEIAEPGSEAFFLFSISKQKVSSYDIATDGEVFYDYGYTYKDKEMKYKIRPTKRQPSKDPDEMDLSFIQAIMEAKYG